MSEPYKTLIQSYVFHGDQAYFVSTCDRNSSDIYGTRFAETLVWEWDATTRKTGRIVWQGEDAAGSISTHGEYCNRLYHMGDKAWEDSDAD